MKSIIFLFALFLALGSFERVLACSCGGMSSCEAYGNSKAVFVGEVVEGYSPERMSDLLKLVSNDLKFVLNVREAFLGTKAKEKIEIYTGTGFGDCGFPFQKGETYLVYASEYEGKLHTSVCSGSSHISRVEVNEFKFLESVAKKPWKGARIFGNVSAIKQRKTIDFNTFDVTEPLGKATLKINDGGKMRNIQTDEKGNYEIDGLEAKKYKLELLLPENYVLDNSTYVMYRGSQNWEPRSIELEAKGYKQEDFLLINDSSLRGRITRADGTGLKEASAQLIPVDSPDMLVLQEYYEVDTNENGEFDLAKIPHGKYLLGVNLVQSPDEKQPYPKTFYPGTTDRAQAKIIEVKPGQKTPGLNFTLTNKLKKHFVRGVVLLEDGKPAPNISITLEDVNRPHVCVNGCNNHTDANGKFEIIGYEGYTYFLVAYDGSKNYDEFEQKTISTPATFKLTGDRNDLKVTLKFKPKKSQN